MGQGRHDGRLVLDQQYRIRVVARRANLELMPNLWGKETQITNPPKPPLSVGEFLRKWRVCFSHAAKDDFIVDVKDMLLAGKVGGYAGGGWNA